MTRRGRLFAGTSGFSYPSWVPKFYAPGKASRKLLPAYAARLPAVELNNTFYRRPSDEAIGRWLEQVPTDFRFCPKAQRGTAWRSWSSDDPAGTVAWLTGALGRFGDQLGCVLMSVPGTLERDDSALERVLTAWPAQIPLALELPHASWQADEVHRRVDAAGVALVATDWDDRDEPDLRRIGPFLYLRLRRSSYGDLELRRWADRIEPFLADGTDAFVFLRHDEDGTNALGAERLMRLAGPRHGGVTRHE